MIGKLGPGRSLTAGVVALVAAVSACSDRTPAGPPKVELSEGKVTITSPRKATASVRYKFTQGRPRAGQWYKLYLSVTAEGNNRGFNLYSGDAGGLSAEGTLEHECTIDPPGTAWKPGETVKYDFTLYEGPSKDARLTGISNRIEGQAQVP
ncbi:MAG TPA: hypothetical protein VH092_16605 [Urbifossiella sp.]|nr:hypothetical protein [Urbifossiella sp.]